MDESSWEASETMLITEGSRSLLCKATELKSMRPWDLSLVWLVSFDLIIPGAGGLLLYLSRADDESVLGDLLIFSLYLRVSFFSSS